MFKGNLVKGSVTTIGFLTPVLRKNGYAADHQGQLTVAGLKVKPNHALRYHHCLFHIRINGAVLWIGKLAHERIKTVFDIVSQNWAAIRELRLGSQSKGYRHLVWCHLDIFSD